MRLGQLRHGTDRQTDIQTDGSRYRLMPPYSGGGIITLAVGVRPSYYVQASVHRYDVYIYIYIYIAFFRSRLQVDKLSAASRKAILDTTRSFAGLTLDTVAHVTSRDCK